MPPQQVRPHYSEGMSSRTNRPAGARTALRGDALMNGRIVPDALIELEVRGAEQVIIAVGPAGRRAAGARARRVDGLIAPGYVDVHIHGAAGHDTLGPRGSQALSEATRGAKSPEPDIAAALRLLARETARHGYAAFVPTAPSLPLPSLRTWVRAVARARDEQSHDRAAGRARDEAIIVGAHIEGPAIAHAQKGANDPTLIIDATNLQADLQNREHDWAGLSIVTLAPEVRGGGELIDYLVARRIVASLGHSAASYEQATTAWSRGASSATHLGTCMEPLDHRLPGLAGAALAHPKVRVEMIADGVHIDLRLAVLYAQLLGSRLMLVSDALSAAGQPDSDFRFGSIPARSANGRAAMSDGTLVGSLSLLDTGIVRIVQAGYPLAAALTAATRTPADLLRLPELGRLAPGAIARLIHVNPATGALVSALRG